MLFNRGGFIFQQFFFLIRFSLLIHFIFEHGSILLLVEVEMTLENILK